MSGTVSILGENFSLISLGTFKGAFTEKPNLWSGKQWFPVSTSPSTNPLTIAIQKVRSELNIQHKETCYKMGLSEHSIYIYYMYTPNFHPWLYQVSLFEMAKKNVGMSMYVPHFWTKPDIKTSDIRWVPQSTWLCEVFPMLLLLLTSCWDGINRICLGTSSVGPFRDCRSHAAFVPPSVLPVKYLIFNVLLYIYYRI